MEQVRFLLAIALSFIVLFVWQNYFLEKPELPPSEITENQTDLKKQSIEKKLTQQLSSKSPDNLLPPEEQPLPQKSIENKTPAKDIFVQSPLFDIEFSERGAAIKNVILLNYTETKDKDSPFKQIVQLNDMGTSLVSFHNQVIPDLDKVVFQADTQRSVIKVLTRPEKLSFTHILPQGIKIVKTYFIDPTSYIIDVNVSISNSTNIPLGDQLNIIMRRQVPTGIGGYIFEGPAIFLDNQLNEIDVDDILEKKVFNGTTSWVAIEDRYFATAILPVGYQSESLQTQMHVQNNIITSSLKLPSMNIAPGTQKNISFQLFYGPKSLALLNVLDNNFNEIINFGWFDILARPCLYLMNMIYQVIPNYGIAIILLTILIKILFWPLGTKSYKSMNDMRKLQPMMKKLQEKYKDDRQKMNQELMALYKTYKVNPLGGCLPMVLQIPVFIALYRMLYQAIELRHAPFFLWINDLSAPDRLFHFNIDYIPLMEKPYGIPVLTIIMGATMLIQQKMSPAPGDPAQAKMMMFLPIVFTFIFINFPAGLVLYWLINNVASILQQYYINKTNL
jgi:YidC/Oxa1 family membrane protein insertase